MSSGESKMGGSYYVGNTHPVCFSCLGFLFFVCLFVCLFLWVVFICFVCFVVVVFFLFFLGGHAMTARIRSFSGLIWTI